MSTTLTLATLEKLPPVVGTEDVEMGRQLTEQWERVKDCRRQDLIFGAMMVRLRANLCARAQVSKGGRGHKGEGMEGWLDRFAPCVTRRTAYRLMEIAEGLAESFKLGTADLESLLTSQIDGMEPGLAKKREQIEKVIDGTSQRQLLLEFGHAEARSRGGWQGGAKEQPLTPAQQMEKFLAACRDDFAKEFMALDRLVVSGNWQAPSIADAELESAIAVAEKFVEQAKAWLKLPQKKRTRPAFGDAAQPNPEESL